MIMLHWEIVTWIFKKKLKKTYKTVLAEVENQIQSTQLSVKHIRGKDFEPV